jgi:hypothetical protein
MQEQREVAARLAQLLNTSTLPGPCEHCGVVHGLASVAGDRRQ